MENESEFGSKKKRNRKKKEQPLEMKLSDWKKIDFGKNQTNYDEIYHKWLNLKLLQNKKFYFKLYIVKLKFYKLINGIRTNFLYILIDEINYFYLKF